MPDRVVKKMIEWTNKGNPSADYKSAKDCRELMDNFRKSMASKCGFTTCSRDDKVDEFQYHIIFTSCASESNNMFLRAVVDSVNSATFAKHSATFASQTATFASQKPHLITSSIEHKSLLNCAVQLAKRGCIELSLVRPDMLGFIHAEDVEAAIRPNTILISIMQANNETGAINDIAAISRIAKSNNILFHTDCVQSFSKFLMNPIKLGVDAFSVSFHKMHGPAGVGAIIINKQIADEYKLEAEICGTQNNGMRGGTENIPGIAAAYEGFLITAENRAAKNVRTLELKKYMIQTLNKQIPCRTYREYLGSLKDGSNIPRTEIILLSTCEKNYLPGTLLIGVLSGRDGSNTNNVSARTTVRANKYRDVCNGKIKSGLEKKGIIISIGSACNTANSKASHVITEMGVPEQIRKGTLRISLGDLNDKCDVECFVKEFCDVLRSLNYM